MYNHHSEGVYTIIIRNSPAILAHFTAREAPVSLPFVLVSTRAVTHVTAPTTVM